MLKINVDLIKSYLRHRYFEVLAALAIFAVAFYYDHNYLYIPLLIGSIAQAYRVYVQGIEKAEWLKSRGLTPADELNIAFVKKWEETRKDGLFTYCVKDGGVIRGVYIGVGCGLLFVGLLPKQFKAILAQPGEMFLFICACYLAGVVIGCAIYRFLWVRNEKRFKTLTDPFVHLVTTDEAAENHI